MSHQAIRLFDAIIRSRALLRSFLLVLAWVAASPTALRAQGVSFASTANATTLCTADAIQTVGTTVLTPVTGGTVLANSSVFLTYGGNDLLGTPVVQGAGAGNITATRDGNIVILRFTNNVVFAPGNVTQISGLTMSTLGFGASSSVNVNFSANSPSPANPITFTAPSRAVIFLITCELTIDSGNDQIAVVDTTLATPLVVLFSPCSPGLIVNFAVTQGGGIVNPVAAVVDAACKASTTLRLGTRTGQNTVTARSTFASTVLSFRAFGTPAPANNWSLVSGNNQTGTVGQQLAEPFVIRVVDTFENTVPRVPFIIDILEGGGTMAFLSGETETAGLISAFLRLGNLPGPNRVKFTSPHLPERDIIFNATANPVVATNLLLNSGNNQTGIAGQPIQPFVVRVVGSNNISIQNAPVTFSVVSGGGTLSATQATTDASGVASTILTLGPNQGVNTVTASSGSLIGSPVTFNALATNTGLAPTLFSGGMVNGASFRQAGTPGANVAPGTIVALFGSELASSQINAQALPLPTTLGDTSVLFNGVAAPLFFVSPGQINAQVPWNLTGSEVAVRIRRGFLEIPSQSFQISTVSPGIFTANSSGSGLGAVLHADTFQPVTDTNRTAPNRRIAVFMTGLGPTNPAAVSGQPAPTPPATTISSLLANIAGSPAPIEFSGLAPGFVGLYQVNLIVPAGTPSGNQELNIIINGVTSNTVTIPVQ
jgi:uncharacterized protein (TIGR03437 family)